MAVVTVVGRRNDTPRWPAVSLNAVPVALRSDPEGARVFAIFDDQGTFLAQVTAATERAARELARDAAHKTGIGHPDGVLSVHAASGDEVARVTFVRAVDDLEPLPPTREECIAAAALAFARARREHDILPVAEAARRAQTPAGPSLAELEQRIAALRAHLAVGRRGVRAER